MEWKHFWNTWYFTWLFKLLTYRITNREWITIYFQPANTNKMDQNHTHHITPFVSQVLSNPSGKLFINRVGLQAAFLLGTGFSKLHKSVICITYNDLNSKIMIRLICRNIKLTYKYLSISISRTVSQTLQVKSISDDTYLISTNSSFCPWIVLPLE